MLKLSTFHRYGIVILALIIMAALFWPTDDKSTNQNIVQNQSQPIVITPPASPEVESETMTTSSSQEPEATPNNNQAILPSETDIKPEPIEPPDTERPQVITPPAKTTEPKTTPPLANAWQNYRVQKGKTLAQLFRDNNLQANDAFIMAKVEGAEKPLSNLQQGQKIRLKVNAKDEVQLLEITMSDGKIYSFARLSDGSYYRTP